MRIGEVARGTGLSARMIRYHDERGHLPGRRRAAGRHRYFDQEDVDWLSGLQGLLAAGVPTATAVRAMRNETTAAEQTEIESALGRLGGHLAVARDRLTPAVLAQIVGVAPSTLSRRVRRLIDRGWVARRPTGSNGRSWVATITPEGRDALAVAHPAFVQSHRLLDTALRRRGVEPEVLRRQLQLLSATLRGLLPDVEHESGDPAVAALVTAAVLPTSVPD